MNSFATEESSSQGSSGKSNQATIESTRALQVVERGFVRRSEPGTRHAVFTFPNITALSDGRLLATVRAGSTKDTDDETTELFESTEGGRAWFQRPFPAPTLVNGKRGSAKSCQITEIEPGRLLGAVMWVDRESYPGKPLFNSETEGCLPMEIMLSDSYDSGETWSKWRVVPLPAEIGPPSLTSAIMKLKDGTLAMSIETNKTYEDCSKWLQKVVLFHSTDKGQTWGPAVTAGCDPEGRIFNWDQRTGVAPDGRIGAFLWTYDSETNTYLNMRRRVSSDGGYTWSQPEDLGFADQAGRPAILPDGRVVLSYVDRFNTQCIRARWASDIAAPFDPETEAVVYSHQTTASTGPRTGATTEALVDQGRWSYGLPCAEALPDGDVIVVYYAGNSEAMDACWARLRLP
ncbi:MAG: exo-alpha-sialidase [Armatimonadetes bacterium]|nr:exo-alpha-sialidase [Armatimonadota bacterium]